MTATIHPLHSEREPSLDPLMQLVADDMNGVNAVILDRMQSKVALIPELAGHLIAGGGKRMRPMLTLAEFPQMRLAVRLPRRIPEPSTTSSWRSVAVWMNSTAAASLWWRLPG